LRPRTFLPLRPCSRLQTVAASGPLACGRLQEQNAMAKEQRSTKEKRKPKKSAAEKSGKK
jgi:hypothetical protein